MPQRKVSCDDCYFRRQLLCALRLDDPCPTFRASGGGRLQPPQQLRLLERPLRRTPVGARVAGPV